MLLIIEIVAFIAGLLFLSRGRARFFWSKKVVIGPPARNIGMVLLLPLIAGCGLGLYAQSILAPTTTEEVFDLLLSPAMLNLILVEVSILTVVLAFAFYLYHSAPASEYLPGQNTPAAPSSVEAPRIMTTAEAARYLRVSEADVLNLINEGRLPASRIGSEYRIARIAIDDMLKEQR